MSYHYRPRFKVTGLELVESTQQNPHYDPVKSCNGGGNHPFLFPNGIQGPGTSPGKDSDFISEKSPCS